MLSASLNKTFLSLYMCQTQACVYFSTDSQHSYLVLAIVIMKNGHRQINKKILIDITQEYMSIDTQAISSTCVNRQVFVVLTTV